MNYNEIYKLFLYQTRNLILKIRETLNANLIEEKNSSQILHLTITLLVYGVHGGCLIYISNDAIALLIQYLSKTLPTNIIERLHKMQGLQFSYKRKL